MTIQPDSLSRSDSITQPARAHPGPETCSSFTIGLHLVLVSGKQSLARQHALHKFQTKFQTIRYSQTMLPTACCLTKFQSYSTPIPGPSGGCTQPFSSIESMVSRYPSA